MILLDANVLLYAYDLNSPHQKVSARWLDEVFHGTELIGIPWATIWAFIRIRTNSRLSESPRPIEETFGVVRSWSERPNVRVLDPGPRHLEMLQHLAASYGVSGPMLSDAVIAAFALENGATVASTDRDFSRFKEVRWVNPLDQTG